jgi:hypothetical protein
MSRGGIIDTLCKVCRSAPSAGVAWRISHTLQSMTFSLGISPIAVVWLS